MRIQSFHVFQVRIPLKKEIRHASHARTSTDSLVVCCELQGGTQGWGEGLPREYVTGETIDQAWELLNGIPWSSAFGAEMSNLIDAVSLVRTMPPARPASDLRGCFGNSLRCALELSVLDAVCRELQKPLSAVTAVVPETTAIRQSVAGVRYSGVFTAMSTGKQIKRALLLRLFGFHQAKVKVGVEGVDDAQMLRRIRRWAGRRIDLRLDANEAWNCGNLEAHVAPLLPYGITSLEQPVPHADIAGLTALRPRLGVPIMFDESLCCEHDARQAIALSNCDLFNLRLSKCGGFVATLRLAALAHQAGLGYQLGCQVGETGILSAAGRHFATSVSGIRYLEGSFDRFLVRERLTREDLTFGYAGSAPALTEPGLGVSIDPAALQRTTIREARFPV